VLRLFRSITFPPLEILSDVYRIKTAQKIAPYVEQVAVKSSDFFAAVWIQSQATQKT
jgi:hypothetical protein